MAIEFILKKEVVSLHKDRKGNYITLANKNDKVELIGDHDNILIVRKGNDRFCVKREDVEIKY